jgi:ubiquinone/menaquinone biosynthesis C-methylase UbiE
MQDGARSPIDYDALAADYARHRRLHPGVLRRLIEGGGVGHDSRVLDVGCGTGNYLLALREPTGCAATGLDPSVEMLTAARRRAEGIPGGAGPVWLDGRAERLPFAPAAFDLVFSVDVIHHVADRSAFFRQAARVLAPGGRLCTATDSADDIARRRPLSSHFPETVPVELGRYPAIETLRAELIDAGLSDLVEERVELTYDLDDARPYRDRAFSSLHLIPEDAFRRGIARLEADLARGPLPCLSLYTLLWATRT